MTTGGNFLVIAWMLCLHSFLGTAEAGGRLKRELRFPKGGSFSAAVALASYLPKGPTDGLVHVLEFDLGFPFPEKFVIAKKRIWEHPQKTIQNKRWYQSMRKPLNNLRKKRNLKEKEKTSLLFRIEDAINRIGFNGSACILRLQCELKNILPENSVLEELLFVIFKNSLELSDRECEVHNQTCPVSLLHVIMHSEQISMPQII